MEYKLPLEKTPPERKSVVAKRTASPNGVEQRIKEDLRILKIDYLT